MADANGGRGKRKTTDRDAGASKQVAADVALLDGLLRDAIAYVDGDAGAALYARALDAKPEDLKQLSAQDAVTAERALACLATFSLSASIAHAETKLAVGDKPPDILGTDVGGKRYLLPLHSETNLLAPPFKHRNETDFLQYRKFSVDATVSYDGTVKK